MGTLKVLDVNAAVEWVDCLKRMQGFDFFHLPSYHQLLQAEWGGDAHLFVYEEGEYEISLPLIVQSVEALHCLRVAGKGLSDATSVYGYAGPLSSHKSVPPPVARDFLRSLQNELKRRCCVSLFSRLHPLLAQNDLLLGAGECVPVGLTVSIDLMQPPEGQYKDYRADHRASIRKLKALGITCAENEDKSHLAEFIEMYYGTLARVHAGNQYYFSREFLSKLATLHQDQVRLFECRFNGNLTCAGLYTTCNGIVQSFLSASQEEFHKLASKKLLIDAVRMWGCENRASVFHLGGGVGSAHDGVFDFKAGFSRTRHTFSVWRWVLLPAEYADLSIRSENAAKEAGRPISHADFFPAYRAGSDSGKKK